MTQFQILTLCAGVIFIASSFVNNLRQLIGKKTTTVTPGTNAESSTATCSTLTKRVAMWEDLCLECERCGLDEACAHLRIMFPALMERRSIASPKTIEIGRAHV